MHLVKRGARATCSFCLLATTALACSGREHARGSAGPEVGGGSATAGGGATLAAGAGGVAATNAGAGGVAPTNAGAAGSSSSNVPSGGYAGLSGAAAGAATAGAGMPSSAGAPASAGSAGASAEPPLDVHPVETWGGKPLDMVPFATSGTRLLAIGYADDGAVFFDAMRDTKLGMDCAFERTTAGDWVCSPLKKQTLIYLDAACSEPAVEEAAFSKPTGELFGSTQTSPTPTGGTDVVLVSSHAAIYRVADEVFASDGETTFAENTLSIYTGGSNGQCSGPRIANPHVVVSPPSIFRATPVADAELVKATVRHVPLTDGLALERLVTDDGAQISGPLTFGGRECELQRDGRCVPGPVAEPMLFTDAACTEYAFRLPTNATPVEPIYGVESQPDDTSKAYELTPTTVVYSQRTHIETVTTDGGTMPMPVVTCEKIDLGTLTTTIVYYQRSREVTAELPKLGSLQLGSATVYPSWFFGTLSNGTDRILLQIHSPDGNWVQPNIRTKDGTVCAVYDDRFKDQCLEIDGVTFLPVSEVNL